MYALKFWLNFSFLVTHNNSVDIIFLLLLGIVVIVKSLPYDFEVDVAPSATFITIGKKFFRDVFRALQKYIFKFFEIHTLH